MMSIPKSILLTIAYFLLFELLGMTYLLELLIDDPTIRTNWIHALISLTIKSVFLLILILYLKTRDIKYIEINKPPFSQSQVMIAFLLGFLFIQFQEILNIPIIQLSGDNFLHEDVKEFAIFQLHDIPLLIGSIIVTPIVEELFFRRYLLAGLTKNNSIFVAILISSILFSFIHIPNFHQMYITFWGGCLAAGLFQKTYRISNSIIFHISWNLFANLGLYSNIQLIDI